MECFDRQVAEAYFNDLTKDIKVGDSINDWSFTLRIYLGGAMDQDYIVIPQRAATYPKTQEMEVYVRIPLPLNKAVRWGITQKHRFNEYAKIRPSKTVKVIPAEYSRFESMADYLEYSIRLIIKQILTNGITYKKEKIKI